MSAHIDLKTIREAGLRRRRARSANWHQGEPARKSLPTVSPEALATADFIKFGPQAREDGGTSCFNCQYKHPDKPLCQYKGEVDLRGLQVYRDTCCAFWDEQGATRPWEGQSAKYNPEDDDGMSWKGSYFGECERDDQGHCLPKGSAGAGVKEKPSASAAGEKKPAKKAPPPANKKSAKVAQASGYQSLALRRMVLHGLRNEGELADAIGGHNLPDSEPADVAFHVGPSGEVTSDPKDFKQTLFRREEASKILRNRKRESADRIESAQRVLEEPLVFFEVKTLHTSKTGRVKMSPAAVARKRRWERRYGAKFKTVVFDDRRGHKHTGHRLYYQDGIGNMKVDAMQKATDFEDVLGRAFSRKSGMDLTEKADPGTKGATMWITIGGHPNEETGAQHSGGTPVLIDGGGRIIGGKVPRSLHGTNIGQFKERIGRYRATKGEKTKEEQKFRTSPFGEAMQGLREGKKMPLKEPEKPKEPETPKAIQVEGRRGPVEVKEPRTKSELRDLIDNWYSDMTDKGRREAAAHLGLDEPDPMTFVPLYQQKGFEKLVRERLNAHYNPVPIQERIKQAKSLHEKTEKIAAIHAEGERKWAEIVDQKANLREQVSKLQWDAEGKRGKSKEKLMHQAQEIEGRIEALKGEQEKVRAKSREQIHKLLVLDKHTPVNATIPKVMSGTEDEKRITTAQQWLTGLVAPGSNGEELPAYMIQATFAGDRASYNDVHHQMKLARGGEIQTVVHEIGHGIEYKMPGAKSAAEAFLKHRQGQERPRKLRDVVGRWYDADETGFKDEFDKAFGDRGWYCGKIYPDGATELISMGVERLYTDAAGFARADPEYCAFVLGVLDGSLRDNPIPEK